MHRPANPHLIVGLLTIMALWGHAPLRAQTTCCSEAATESGVADCIGRCLDGLETASPCCLTRLRTTTNGHGDAAIHALVLEATRQDEAPSEEQEESTSFWDQEKLTGDWGGLRTRIADAGISFDALYTLDLSYSVAGGIRNRFTPHGLLDMSLTFDLETIVGLEGGTVFVGTWMQHGRDGSIDVGDIQAYSNIDSDDMIIVSELWYEQLLFSGALRLKIGRVDFSSEFSALDASGDFINSSGAFSPTIFVGPTYPDPATSLNVFVEPVEWLRVGFGVYDAATDGTVPGRHNFSANFDDVFVIYEADFRWSLGIGDGHFLIGGWHHTGDFARFDGGLDDGADGFFLGLEQMLLRENPDEGDDAQGLSAFLQFGLADEEQTDVHHHLSFGLVWVGLFPGRDDDSTGLYVSFVDLSDDPFSGYSADETTFELYHRFQLTPFFSLKPDFQYIVNPGGGGVDDAFVATVRVEIVF